jgi:arylsulfatase A-like enzyme
MHNRARKEYKEGYTTQIFTDEAIGFLKRHQGDPFFLTVSFNSLHHLIHEVPDKYLKRHGCDPIPNYDPSMGKYEDYYRKYAVPDPVDEKWRRFYLANLECLDDNIGCLLGALDELQLSENTLVIFFSDNGGSPYTGANNKPLSGSKYNLREGGIRVPLMMRFPGRFRSGVTCPHIVSSLDILPTCLAAAGIGLADVKFDGCNLMNVLSGHESGPVRSSPLFWGWKKQYAVRQGDWKLLKLDEKSPCLYNLKNDIAEQHDLSTRHPEKLQELMDAYKGWSREMEAEYSRNGGK